MTQRLRILLSNDDGYQAPGLRVMAETLAEFADITVVAPDRNRSGASNSLTLDSPLRVHQAENGYFYLAGTPTDCVHLAITGLMSEEPDLVVAGINNGANMGDDVLYSGTVAAAIEGRFLGLPALAVSCAAFDPEHFQTAADITLGYLKRMQQSPLASDIILNINVPDLPLEKITGHQATRLGHRHKAEPVIRETDPHGREIYWVGPVGKEQDAGPGTDFYAIHNNAVSVTPLQVDMTQHSSVVLVKDWLVGIGL